MHCVLVVVVELGSVVQVYCVLVVVVELGSVVQVYTVCWLNWGVLCKCALCVG